MSSIENILWDKTFGGESWDRLNALAPTVVDNGRGTFEPEDNLRIIIWDEADNAIYDNQQGADIYTVATTPIGRGNIDIHNNGAIRNLASIAGFKTYPVPLAKEGIWLELSARIEPGIWHISILDTQGTKVAETFFPGVPVGTKKQWQLDHQAWQKGTYIMVIKIDQIEHQIKLLK